MILKRETLHEDDTTKQIQFAWPNILKWQREMWFWINALLMMQFSHFSVSVLHVKPSTFHGNTGAEQLPCNATAIPPRCREEHEINLALDAC